MVASHTTKVPFLDLGVQYKAIRRDFNEALEEILELAGIHKLAVVEDAAQAHGARYKEKRKSQIPQ